MTYFARLLHRDGAADRHVLGEFEDQTAALRRARELMLVSQSAVAAELFSTDTLVGRIQRFDSAA